MTQIDEVMEIYENPACYEGAGAIYKVGVGGEGCKGADRRQRREGGAQQVTQDQPATLI